MELFKIDEYLHETNLEEYFNIIPVTGEEFGSLIKDCSIRSCIIIVFSDPRVTHPAPSAAEGVEGCG